MVDKLTKVSIYTDGSCLKNPGGAGGWAAILKSGQAVKTVCGGEPYTTNNRMELKAAIEGLRQLKTRCEVELFTDSKYVTFYPVKNIKANFDLWKDFGKEAEKHILKIIWIKGHSGHEENELCDYMAKQSALEAQKTHSYIKPPPIYSPNVLSL
jgi:ribonuclease HI